MTGEDFRIVQSALEAMEDAPRELARALSMVSELRGQSRAMTKEDMFQRIQQDVNDPIAITFHQKLAVWDYVPSADWVRDTGRNTAPRRRLIYENLQLNEAEQSLCEKRFPYAPALDAPTLIEETKCQGWEPWYTEERARGSNYYWKAYLRYLRDKKEWDPKNLAVLDETTNNLVGRLADPMRSSPYQCKGLVVGYVQSGKTANFTGAIARAADAGYRLIIILSGIMNILRDQTQRRIDKELIGQEIAEDDYSGDDDFTEFISYGGLPSQQGSFDWERLTGAKEDFRRLNRGISALEFRLHDPSKPYYAAENLRRDRVRLIVIKKNGVVLDKLIRDLKKIARRVNLDSVPALVIDDESDQASINTTRPPSGQELEKERRQRTAINRRIVTLLGLLKRAQYVGYTATPFANVFVDPEDAEDLYPKDFILSLPRPAGYMGASDFFDEADFPSGDYNSNENAFVRFVGGEDELPDNLPMAIDAFVLTGAIKLYRQARNGADFQHHTMLAHNSPFVNVHSRQADQVRQLFEEANYAGAGPGLRRLERLWESDFSPMSAVRAEPRFQQQPSFTDLKEYVGECIGRINRGGKPVLIVNGNNRDEAPNFEKESVWKILVGGAKLSRGYTVEGLTVTYYRRRVRAADTLMQMGRWFGFRPGYRDLVRLYIGNNEPIDRGGVNRINLYEAFRAVCDDEEEFRGQLKRYSSLDPGERITPKQVPPLVPSHMLRPSAPNKMFNAQIAFRNLSGEWVESTTAPDIEDDVAANEKLMRELLSGQSLVENRISVEVETVGPPQKIEKIDLSAFTCDLTNEQVFRFLDGYKWSKGHERTMERVKEFLGSETDDPEIDHWLFFSPQPMIARQTWTINGQDLAIRLRSRAESGARYRVYSEPLHRLGTEYFAGVKNGKASKETQDLRRDRQGVLLFYPVLSERERREGRRPTMAFALRFPLNGNPKRISYTVADPKQAEAVTVPIAVSPR